jgi:hypothetical protein
MVGLTRENGDSSMFIAGRDPVNCGICDKPESANHFLNSSNNS